MRLSSFSPIHLLSFVIAVSAIVYVTVSVSEVEAVYSRTVGTLSVTHFVPNEGDGTEYVTLAFSGILGQESVADFRGWSLENASGTTFDLSQVVLPSKQQVKICEASSSDPTCDYFWSTPDVFADEAGELQVIARDGTTVVYIPYTDPQVGHRFSGSGNYIDDVYTSSDKITVCEQQKNGDMRMHDSSMKKLTTQMDAAIEAGQDIVPPFVYETKNSLGYHPGINWPEQAAVLENGCQL